MEEWPVRGIANPTGTSCHVGSALVLLNYCLEPLGSLIVAEAAANSHNDDVVHVVGELFRNQNDPEGVNVKLVFDTLRKEVGIEARDVGDVITTLMKLINYFCQLAKDDEHQEAKKCTIKSVWNQSCNAGKVHSVLLVNCKGEDGCDCSTLRKETKPRSMPVPFLVEVPTCEQLSLADVIRNALQPKLVKDYIWENRNPCKHTQTLKTLYIDNLPPVWLLHLDWFPQPDGESDFHTLSIPSKVMVHEIIGSADPDENRYYELVGGILLSQIHDEEITDKCDRRHYLPLIRKDNIWYMLDDDEVPQIVPEERCLDLFGGASQGKESVFREKGENVSVCGYLLVYREPTQLNNLNLFCDQDKGRSDIDWTLPKTLVGRRLRVQWAKGTFYGGVVNSYNETTRKHQILYDDGDMKEYILRKKTIEWL